MHRYAILTFQGQYHFTPPAAVDEFRGFSAASPVLDSVAVLPSPFCYIHGGDLPEALGIFLCADLVFWILFGEPYPGSN